MKISFETIMMFFLFGLTCSLFLLYFYSIQKIKLLNKTLSDLFLKNSVLQQQIDSFDAIANYDTHKENFIKFLSDSRDWAFEYIDKSQKQIKEFVDMADKEFAFFDSFGLLTEEYPNYDTMKKMSEEYKKLKSLLPEESDDRR